VAIMQVQAYRTKDQAWERLTRFLGALFLINFAMRIVTGVVQEFQFGMNWSNYSVFVGNIFGAPLAMEGLIAFLAERYVEPAERGAQALRHSLRSAALAPRRIDVKLPAAGGR